MRAKNSFDHLGANILVPDKFTSYIPASQPVRRVDNSCRSQLYERHAGLPVAHFSTPTASGDQRLQGSGCCYIQIDTPPSPCKRKLT